MIYASEELYMLIIICGTYLAELVAHVTAEETRRAEDGYFKAVVRRAAASALLVHLPNKNVAEIKARPPYHL